MELYGKKSSSIPQKVVIISLEIILLFLSWWILFQSGGKIILGWIGITVSSGNLITREIIFVFSLIVFARMSFTLVYLLKRHIPWEESVSVPMAFALYYIGYALLGYNRMSAINWPDYFAIGLFLTGCAFNTVSEIQRHFWKKRPENKGKLYTKGLFRYSMHINYFGDVLWVSAYAIVTRNWYSIFIPVFLLSFFIFYNIPQLDAYLASKYGIEFEEYKINTRNLIPFIY